MSFYCSAGIRHVAHVSRRDPRGCGGSISTHLPWRQQARRRCLSPRTQCYRFQNYPGGEGISDACHAVCVFACNSSAALCERTPSKQLCISFLLCRYMSMFLPDAGFAITPCARFSHDAGLRQAQVVATQHWVAGQAVPRLSAKLAQLKPIDWKTLICKGDCAYCVWLRVCVCARV